MISSEITLIFERPSGTKCLLYSSQHLTNSSPNYPNFFAAATTHPSHNHPHRTTSTMTAIYIFIKRITDVIQAGCSLEQLAQQYTDRIFSLPSYELPLKRRLAVARLGAFHFRDDCCYSSKKKINRFQPSAPVYFPKFAARTTTTTLTTTAATATKSSLKKLWGSIGWLVGWLDAEMAPGDVFIIS